MLYRQRPLPTQVEFWPGHGPWPSMVFSESGTQKPCLINADGARIYLDNPIYAKGAAFFRDSYEPNTYSRWRVCTMAEFERRFEEIPVETPVQFSEKITETTAVVPEPTPKMALDATAVDALRERLKKKKEG